MAAKTSSGGFTSLPKGGGALHGIGEKFAPDLHTGTGNFTIPIALPTGRNGFQPQLNLVYSTGNGNGPFGLGWGLSVPGVTRRTSKGIPTYRDADVFLLSGAEDLVPVASAPEGATRYRPRTEGLFALIDHYTNGGNDYWEVRTKDGLVSTYGTKRPDGAPPDWQDPAVVADPLNRSKRFAWKLTETTDPFGNRIVYEYKRDLDRDGPHRWDQLYLESIQYADYATGEKKGYLVSLMFDYEDRPDAFSEYRSGFEIRTRRRCQRIRIETHPENTLPVRTYHLHYLDQPNLNEKDIPANAVSLLHQVWVEGHDPDAKNLLSNASFDVAGPNGAETHAEGKEHMGPSAAADWTLYNNETAVIETQLAPSTFPAAGRHLHIIHVKTTGKACGLVQTFGDRDTGPDRVVASAWIFVKRGRVAIGAGNDGETYQDVLNSTTDRWEFLQARNGVSPANEFIVYSATAEGAEFYVANACVGEVPPSEWLPPLEFKYSAFQPANRKFGPLTGPDLPATSLGNPDLELADLFGNGLPDIFEMNGVVRHWRNLGEGAYDRPREMRTAPAGYRLADPGVQLIDANGDGRVDLLVSTERESSYFPLRFGATWGPRTPYAFAPSFSLEDAEVRLLDLDGDGVTDALRSSTSFECYFQNRAAKRWEKPVLKARGALDEFPNVNFSDPRVKFADMIGDGLQDIVLIHGNAIEYWPNLGHGEWGKRISMHNSPRFPDLPGNYDPKRVLLGDVDGDGLADLIYVDDRNTTIWINQSGNSWSEPILIPGTPRVSNVDAIRLCDVLGTGVSGVLWTSDATSASAHHMYFLDFTGGVKPYVLNEMNNHMGAVTRVEYASSTRFYLEDEKRGGTPWTTPLPFPVQVVSRVEVIDAISGGKLTTEYTYHHGYWDGEEREFRGFGRVDQRDTGTFETYNTPGLHEDTEFQKVPKEQFSPPTETRTWFHQGAIENERGDWNENDLSCEFWPEDRQMLQGDLNPLEPPGKREALRALRGRILRTELYGLDGDAERRKRPYTVTEYAYDLKEIDKPDDTQKDRLRIFFPYTAAQRTTEWERGREPMSEFQFTDDYDLFGQPQRQTSFACPRGWSRLGDILGKPWPYLVTRTRTVYASPEPPGPYIHDRVAKATTFELLNDGKQKLEDLQKLPDDNPAWNLIGQTVNCYDGEAFKGLELGRLGAYGALVRNESLVLTEGILTEAYKTGIEVQNPPELPTYLRPDGPPAWDSREYPDGFQNLPLFDRSMDPTRPEFPVVLAGYGFSSGGGGLARGYWSAIERWSYDFQNGAGHRGLVVGRRDPLGHETEIIYDPDDPYAMFPAEIRDPIKLITRADYDLRVFQPRCITDPNENVTEYAFTPLGLLKSIQLKGKLSRNAEGDKQQPSTEFEYSFLNSPVSVRTIRHVHHDTEVLVDAERDSTIETVEHSDGFGRLLQTRTQAEEGGMIGWWRFADAPGSIKAFDSSGAENYGTLSGGVAFVDDPVFGSVVDFTTADGEVRVPHKPELEPATGTISVWVRFAALQNADVIMKTTDRWVRTDPNRKGGYSVIGLRTYDTGEVDGFVGNDDPTTPSPWRHATTPPNLIVPDEWHQLVLRWDGHAVATFVNGVRQASTDYDPVPGAGLSYHNGSALGFGVWTRWGPGSEKYNFIGRLADARYYARARTDAEIWNDFASERKARFGGVPPGLQRHVSDQTYPVKGQGRVVVSGWQTYDNKGRVVEKFEPSFSTGWNYVPPREEEHGKKVSMYYDQRGHVIRTENPDGSVGQVVYGVPGTIVEPDLGNPNIFEPTPWETYTYDRNDNAGRTDPEQSLTYAEHCNTPSSSTADALGRTVEAVERDAMIRITMLSDGKQSNAFWFSVGPPHAAGAPISGVSTVADGPVIKELTPWNVMAGGPDFTLTVRGSGFSPNAIVQWNGSDLETKFISGEQLTATVRAKNIATATLYITRSVYDIRGNLLRVVDPLGREAFRHVYDLANRPWRIESIDAGLRRIVLDAAGNEIERRDAKGALTLRGYDVLNRPARLWARDQAAREVTLRERLTYGDGGDANQPDAERALNRESNLLGRLQEHYDEAGLLTFLEYDFKGSLLHKERRVFTDEAIRNNQIDWDPSDGIPGDRLEETTYRTSSAYDALNHVIKEQYPLDVSGARKELIPRYNRAGALTSVDLDGKPFVQQLAYNAKGQRTFIAYGNNVVTRYTYDPKTFRLTAMRTDRCDHPADDAYAAAGPPLQEYTYSYDFAGNILTIQDSTPGSGVQVGDEGRDCLTRRFSYDPLYRLTSAVGRECKTAKPRPWTDDSRCGFDSFRHGTVDQNNAPNETALYIEEYAYDACGNMIRLKHRQGADSWTRNFGIGNQNAQQWDQTWRDRLARDQRGEEWIGAPGKKLPGNQLTSVGDDDPNLAPTHYFDTAGNVVRENGNRYFDWDYRDRMREFRVQAVPADPSVRADYLYDSAGQRVKKLVSKGDGKQTAESTVYIDGIFEHHRWVADNAARQDNWLHVMDNQSRIALQRVGDTYSGDRGPDVQYHLGDHLGSSTLMMGEDGDQINREEYFPYGETSFGSFAKKRYRFTGKERDEESGLYYHGARYYAPWVARWTACDPMGTVDGLNLYVYVRNSPLRLVDHSGTQVGSSGDWSRDFENLSPEERVRYDVEQRRLTHIEKKAAAGAGGTIEDKRNAVLAHAGALSLAPPIRQVTPYYSARDRKLDQPILEWLPGATAGWLLGEALSGTTVSGHEVNRGAKLLAAGLSLSEDWGKLEMLYTGAKLGGIGLSALGLGRAGEAGGPIAKLSGEFVYRRMSFEEAKLTLREGLQASISDKDTWVSTSKLYSYNFPTNTGMGNYDVVLQFELEPGTLDRLSKIATTKVERGALNLGIPELHLEQFRSATKAVQVYSTQPTMLEVMRSTGEFRKPFGWTYGVPAGGRY